jgi:hypothetical protein
MLARYESERKRKETMTSKRKKTTLHGPGGAGKKEGGKGVRKRQVVNSVNK